MKLGSSRVVLAVLVAGAMGSAVLAAACTAGESDASAEPVVVPVADAGGSQDSAPVLDAADAARADASTCVPRAPQGALTWVPPKPWHQDKCTRAEIAELAFYCFENDPSATACTSFAAQHPTCMACAVSKDTDPARGPIVFYGNDIYRELNFVGCIANSLGDTSASSCGAAYGKADECSRRACAGCMPVLDQAGEELRICRDSKPVSLLCGAEFKDFQKKCPEAFGSASPDNPTNVCKDHFSVRDYVTMWCGPPPADAGDAAPGP